MIVNSNALIAVLREMDALNIRETNIAPEDGGWKFRVADPAGVSMIDAFIKPEAFAEGESLEGLICVPTSFMLDVLQPNKDCDITIKDGSIVLKYDNARRSKRLIEPEERNFRIPQLDGMSTSLVMSDEIISIAKQKCFDTIKTENNGIEVTMHQNDLLFDATSEVESAQLLINATSVLEDGEEQTALYGSNIIFPVLKALPKNTLVTVMMRTDYPLQVNINDDMYSMDLFMAPMQRQE